MKLRLGQSTSVDDCGFNTGREVKRVVQFQRMSEFKIENQLSPH